MSRVRSKIRVVILLNTELIISISAKLLLLLNSDLYFISKNKVYIALVIYTINENKIYVLTRNKKNVIIEITRYWNIEIVLDIK